MHMRRVFEISLHNTGCCPPSRLAFGVEDNLFSKLKSSQKTIFGSREIVYFCRGGGAGSLTMSETDRARKSSIISALVHQMKSGEISKSDLFEQLSRLQRGAKVEEPDATAAQTDEGGGVLGAAAAAAEGGDGGDGGDQEAGPGDGRGNNDVAEDEEDRCVVAKVMGGAQGGAGGSLRERL